MCVLDNTAQGLGQGKKQAHLRRRLAGGRRRGMEHGERSEKGGRARREVGNNL